jgi:hypothetical protein
MFDENLVKSGGRIVLSRVRAEVNFVWLWWSGPASVFGLRADIIASGWRGNAICRKPNLGAWREGSRKTRSLAGAGICRKAFGTNDFRRMRRIRK